MKTEWQKAGEAFIDKAQCEDVALCRIDWILDRSGPQYLLRFLMDANKAGISVATRSSPNAQPCASFEIYLITSDEPVMGQLLKIYSKVIP